MFELLYTSVAPAGLSDSVLMDILEKSRLKNESLGITGMLIYHDREVMQLLEGEKSKVQELFHSISEDSRHSSVNVFYDGEIEDRAFSDWSMAFKFLDENMLSDITGGYEGFSTETSPISMIVDSSNRGKEIFISLRDKL